MIRGTETESPETGQLVQAPTLKAQTFIMRLTETLSKVVVFSRERKPSYGYYYVKPYLLMLSLFVFFGLGIASFGIRINHPLFLYVGLAIIAYGILSTLGWVLARYVIPGNRVKFARNVVADLNLSGSELALDVGSGKGLYAIEMAKALTTGKVFAIDLWDPQNVSNPIHHHKLSQPTGNTIINAQRNAKIEGVAEKIEFLNMDANHLQFNSDTFDLIVCGFIVGHQGKYGLNVLKEINRVLKPRGRLLLIDNVRDLTYLLLSTPHLFVLSYLRGTKAKQLTKKKWYSMIAAAGFHIHRFEAKKSILVVQGTA